MVELRGHLPGKPTDDAAACSDRVNPLADSSPSAATARTVAAAPLEPLGAINGPWTLAFEPRRGAPRGARNTALGLWSLSQEPAIRYFSGTGTYTREIDVPDEWLRPGRAIQVTINGRKVGQAWKLPYRLDVSFHLERDRNRLVVEVTNLWVNRLIGDAQPHAARVTFAEAPAYTAAAPLRPSGLLGPVTVWAQDVAH